MSSTVGEVKIALKLDGSGVNAGAGKTLGSAFGNAWTVASGNLISAGLSALMATAVQVGKEIISTGMAYEKAMSEVKAISGATADELEKLSTQALKSAKTTIFTSSEVASAYKYMAMAGWDIEEMMAGLDGILNLAAASNLDLARTSDIVTDALTAFGYQASESAHFADVLARVATNANTNVDLMGESFKYVGAIAGTMKYSIEDVGVALGLMANAGIKASQAGTSLRSIISRMAAPTDKVKAAMDELGITMTNSKGEAKSFEEVMKDLRKGFAGLSESQKTQYASTIAGKNAMTGLLAIINSSDEDFDKLTTAIDDSKDAAQDMADTMKDNLSGDVTELNSKLDVLYVNLYEKIEPVLRGIVQFLGGVVDVITTVVDVLGGVVNAITQNEIAMTVIQGVIKGVSGIMTNFIGVVSNVIGVVQSLSGVVDFAKGVFENFKGGFDGVVEKVKEGAGNIGTKFGEMKDNIGTAIGGALEKVKEWGVNMFETAKQVGGDFLIGIATFFAELPGKVWNFLVQTVNKVAEFAINLSKKAKEAAKGAFDAIVNTISQLPGKMLEIGKNIVEGLWNGINGAVGWLKDKIWSFASSVVDTIKNALGIQSPSKVFRDEVGVYMAQGIGVGFDKEMKSVADDMKNSLASDLGLSLGAIVPMGDLPEPEYNTSITSLAQMALDMGEETEQMETENQPLIVNLEMDGQQIQQVILQDIRRSA